MCGLDLLDNIKYELIQNKSFNPKIELHRNFKYFIDHIEQFDIYLIKTFGDKYREAYNEIVKIKDEFDKSKLQK